MGPTLPLFRADISVDVHSEDGENFLLLSDPFDVAEGPIMVHADMVEGLEACDGQTTWEQVASAAGVATDSAEMLRLQGFVSSLEAMGYFETETAERRKQQQLASWAELTERPPAFAGTAYPADAAELTAFLDKLCTPPTGQPLAQPRQAPRMLLLPHIDFRVAGAAYAMAAPHLRSSAADLVVMIGTSHYWHEHTIITTSKHHATPLGTLQTDRGLVEAFHDAMAGKGLQVSPHDLAHKPEHSLEFHAVLLRHLLPDSQLTVLPILVGGSAGPDALLSTLVAAADALREVVSASGRSVLWLVSGDLSHYGRRFGDPGPATSLHDQVTQVDHTLLDHLQVANATAFHQAIARTDNRTNVCGHGPLLLSLLAAEPRSGNILAYEVWDDVDTQSAVTFASAAWE
jgi:AmmeMemoRadiSam system protein B